MFICLYKNEKLLTAYGIGNIAHKEPNLFLFYSCVYFCVCIRALVYNSTFFCVRCALDAEILKYVDEAYPKGICSVYCGNGKDVEGPGSDFELVVVISAARHSPQNFWCVKLVIYPTHELVIAL